MSEAGSRRAVEVLLDEGWSLYDEARYADALRVAEKAREAAKQLGDIGLEVRAANLEATALSLLGRQGEALARYSWILGVAEDPAHRAALADENVAKAVVTAFIQSAECALYLPPIQVAGLFKVLDAGERFARAIGKPAWRAGLLSLRSDVLRQLGRTDEAIGCAEEGLALELRDPTTPGPTRGSYRWGLGNLLREAGRRDEARVLYQTVLDDVESHPGDRFVALRGLVRCALGAGDPAGARRFAEQAVRLAEPMGDDVLSTALETLTDACLALDDVVAARAASDRYLAVARRLDIVEHLFFALDRAARVALAERDYARAAAFVAEAQPHAEALDRAANRHYYCAMLDKLRAQLTALESAAKSG